MARIHNELSQVVVTASPKDLEGDPYTPVTARYRVDDCDSEKQMVDWTTLIPAESMQIIVPGTVNTIISNRKRSEVKTVTVQTDTGLSTQHNEQFNYKIKNLKFVK